MPAPDLASSGGAAVVQEGTRRSRKRRAATEGGAVGDEEAKSGGGGKNEYECRFCSMKFEKSQALGGHMNRHRQEREKEQFQHAQQIVSSVAQQQIPRTWSSLSAEIIESPSGPSGNSGMRLSSHLSGGVTHQQFVAPPISFGTSYRPTSPPNPNLGVQLPPSPGSNCNYYLSPNASSCNLAGNTNSMHNQHNQQQQLQQWIGSMDGFSSAASNSPRSVSFRHQPNNVENSMAISLQAAAGVPSELLASMLRNSSTPTDGSPSLQVSPGTPTSSQAQAQVPGTYDVIYNSQQLANAFYHGGM